MATLSDLLAAADAARDEAAQLTCDLVRIPTVNTGVIPTGDELPACRLLAGKLAADGIDSCIYEPAENRGNLVATLHGDGGGTRRLLLMSHLDVVPTGEEALWTRPPFSAALENGRIWGRGAADCKDLAAVETMTLILLKRAGVRLRGDLVLAAAGDEETGGEYGFGWLARNAPEAIAAQYAVNEGGGAPPLATPKGLLQTMMVGEKGRLELRITLCGTSGHAALPWLADNAALKLGRVLVRLEESRPELSTSLPFFNGLSDLVGEPITPANVDEAAARLEATSRGLASVARGLSRMTVVPTMVRGGIKSNSIPDTCVLTCDVRILPQHDEAYVQRCVEALLDGIPGASYELSWTARPSDSPYDTPFAASLRRATEAALGVAPMVWLPALTSGFTDSRLVRPLGTTIYAIGSGHLGPESAVPGHIHGVDESLDVESLVFRMKTLLALAWEVLGGT